MVMGKRAKHAGVGESHPFRLRSRQALLQSARKDGHPSVDFGKNPRRERTVGSHRFTECAMGWGNRPHKSQFGRGGGPRLAAIMRALAIRDASHETAV